MFLDEKETAVSGAADDMRECICRLIIAETFRYSLATEWPVLGVQMDAIRIANNNVADRTRPPLDRSRQLTMHLGFVLHELVFTKPLVTARTRILSITGCT